MDTFRQFAIGVREGGLPLSANPLFSALSTIFPVKFRPWTNGNCHGLDALILCGQDAGGLQGAAAAGLPVMVMAAPPSAPAPARAAEFQLRDDSSLSACLRGHCFEEPQSASVSALPVAAGDVVLASQEGQPVWLRRRMERAVVTMVGWPLPVFSSGDHIFENFHSSRFLRLLPILQFLRDLTYPADWRSPPTTACLLVDDPNFHSMTYGYLDFRRLAAEALEHRFYVSIATAPLDCWWINRQISELFRKYAPRLSVLLHGNDHIYEELARSASDADNLALLAQALRRCQRLERQQPGMEFCRVMECPHGSLSLAMLEPMAKLGYEAVFASTAHLLRCNRGTTFCSSLGAEQTRLESRGVPVIPRIRAEEGWRTEVRLAAFLQRPIILAAHHWDFAGQSHLADDFAEIVNGLPDVRWASPTGVARACYQFREVGDVLHLKLGSRLVDVPVPHSVQWVMIHRPWLQGVSEPERLVVRAQQNQLFRAVSSADVIGPIPLRGGTALRVSSSLPDAVDCNSVPPPRRRYWPVVRKVMVEIRDRSCLHVHMRSRARHAVKHLQERVAWLR